MNSRVFLLIILLTGLLFLPAGLRACDICGCGAGTYYTGIMPEFNKKIMGLRYRLNGVREHLGPGGRETYLTRSEKFHTIEWWAGWNIKQRWRITAELPFTATVSRQQQIRGFSTGLNDVRLQSFYKLIDQQGMAGNKLLLQSLWIGAGIKLPTSTSNNTDASPGILPYSGGTGTVDFSGGLLYELRVQDAGISTLGWYQHHTRNSAGYKNGDRISLLVQGYYKFRIRNSLTLAPLAGISYDRSAFDKKDRIVQPVSGGWLLRASSGLQIAGDRYLIGWDYQPVMAQRLAENRIHASGRMNLQLALLLR